MKTHSLATLLTIAMVCLALSPSRLSAADIYWGGGDADIANDTPLPATSAGLCGNWDAATKNWANTPSGSVYATFSDGNMLWLGKFVETNVQVYITNSVNAQFAGMAGSPPHIANSYLNIYANAGTPTVLTPTGDRVVINSVTSEGNAGLMLRRYVTLAGSAPLHKTGNGLFRVAGNCDTYTGPISIDMGVFAVVPDASGQSLNGVTSVTLLQRVNQASASSLSGNQVPSGTFSVQATGAGDNKLNDNLVVTFKRGQFTYNQPASSTETMGKIVADPWGWVSGNNYGTGGGVLTLSDATAGISRGGDGLGTLFFSVPSEGAPRVNIRVPNGVATDTLLPWFITSRAEFMLVDSANNNTLTQIVSTAAAADLTTWDTTYGNTSNVRIGNGTAVNLTGSIDNNTTIKSLGIFNTAATTCSIADGVTLTVASGGIAFIPGSDQRHHTILGGSLASGTDKLYVSANETTLNAGLYIISPIIGTLDLIKSGVPQVEFRGGNANTYDGTTYVNSGNMSLNKVADVLSIPGNLVIKYGGSVTIATANQINQNADVTIQDGGLLALTTGNQTHNGQVSINGGTYYINNRVCTMTKSGAGFAFNGGWFVHNSSSVGTLNLQTDVSYASGSTSQARFELYNTSVLNIELDGGNRTFNIADSATLPADVPEMVIDTPIIPGSPAGGSITKTGTGVLLLTGRNTYTGGTTINGGVVRVGAISAPAQSDLTAYTQYSANLNRPLVFTTPVAKKMMLGQTVTGANIPAGRTIQRVIDDYQVLLNNTAVLNGTQLVNVVVGPVWRGGSAGTGAAAVNNTGTLQIDALCWVTNQVNVNIGGTLTANGALVGVVTNNGTVNGGGLIATVVNDGLGTLKPGTSIGTLAVQGNFTAADQSTLELEWDDGVTNDIVVVGGNFEAQGTPVIKIVNIGGIPSINTQVVLKVTGTYTGPVGGYSFDLPTGWAAISSGGDLLNLGGGNYGLAFIPEPASVLLLLALGALARKRN